MKKAIVAAALGYLSALLVTTVAEALYRGAPRQERLLLHSLYPIGLGVSAIAVTYAWDRNLRAIPFRRPRFRDIARAALLAVAMLLIPFLVTIACGFIRVGRLSAIDPTLAVVGLPVLILLAVGEEVLWRGVLQTEFVKRFSFAQSGVLIGALWAVWHYPLILRAHILYAGYPAGYALPAFTLAILAMGYVPMWLREVSGSVWPPVVWHGLLNYIAFVLIQPLEGVSAHSPLPPYAVRVDIGVWYLVSYAGFGLLYALRLSSRSADASAEGADD